jgi:hypothetical protein
MTSLAVTVKGQVTLKRDLLQHLGVKPGERIDFEKLPGGELRVRAARPTGSIEGFLQLRQRVGLANWSTNENLCRYQCAGSSHSAG